jgi:ABC-type uncharacterized transport system permease subunit
MSLRRYGWYFGAFGALIASGIAIAIAAVTLLGSLVPLDISIALSIGAIVLAIVAWLRYPKHDAG